MKALFAFLLLCGISIPSFADDAAANTGNELINACNTKSDQAKDSSWVYCVAFINGIVSGAADLETRINWPPAPSPSAANDARTEVYKRLSGLYCIPANANWEQLGLVVTKFLVDHPEQLNLPASTLVIDALEKAWPCPRAH